MEWKGKKKIKRKRKEVPAGAIHTTCSGGTRNTAALRRIKEREKEEETEKEEEWRGERDRQTERQRREKREDTEPLLQEEA